ncbi:MAG: ABC transporter permease subunit, partial [Deltaproteobacteria bacterium]|nr:ABC transporter permease subunit [Deltaproteobacteria bacterium]
MTEPDVPAPTGTIHDLGYRRYEGARRSDRSRWRVIARHQVAIAWKTWWRFRAPLGLAIIAMSITAGMMMFASERKSSLGRAQIFAQRLIDTALPEAIIWFCRVGFLASLTLGATIVASDIQSGAFTFYFARSTRPRHYVIGKLVGLGALTALIVAAGPLVLAGLRLGVADNTDELVELLPVIPKTLAVGGLATLAYCAVPLGFSALLPNRRHALALWASYYLIFGAMAYALAHVASPAIGALDLPVDATTALL